MPHFVPGIRMGLVLARHLSGFRRAVEDVVESVLQGLDGIAEPCVAMVAGLAVDVRTVAAFLGVMVVAVVVMVVAAVVVMVVAAVVVMVVPAVVVVGEHVVGAVNPKLFRSEYKKLSIQVILSFL